MNIAPATSAPRGVYMLGNDHVADYLEALFISLRQHSPDLPARLIPYDGRLTRTRELCARHRIEIHTDLAFPALEQLGLGLWTSSPYSNHQNLFRRLCIFWGPFDNFLYLDADICVLSPLEPLFDAFEKSPVPFASFDVDHERVYQAGPLRDRMIREHGSLGFNSGHFFSRLGVFDLEKLQSAMRAAQPLAHLFQDRGDQGFLNFAVDHFGVPQTRMTRLLPGLADKQWCEQRFKKSGPRWIIDRPGDVEDGKQICLIHWSGYNLPGWHIPNRAFYYRYRGLGLSAVEKQKLLARDFWRHHSRPLRPFLDRVRIRAGGVRRRLGV